MPFAFDASTRLPLVVKVPAVGVYVPYTLVVPDDIFTPAGLLTVKLFTTMPPVIVWAAVPLSTRLPVNALKLPLLVILPAAVKVPALFIVMVAPVKMVMLFATGL